MRLNEVIVCGPARTRTDPHGLHGPARTCTDSHGPVRIARIRTYLHGPARTRTDRTDCTDPHVGPSETSCDPVLRPSETLL